MISWWFFGGDDQRRVGPENRMMEVGSQERKAGLRVLGFKEGVGAVKP